MGSILTGQTICPVNTPLESTIGEWDWTQQIYTIYYKVGATNIADNNVISPFFDLTNNGAPNTEYLETNPPDFALEDGWELLYKNFGGPIPGTSATEYVDAPSFALYNRYSGQVRTLVYHPTDNSASFNIMQVRAANWNIEEESAFETGNALFSYMETPSKALDRFDAFGNEAGAFNRYVDGGVWSTLDYVAAYDPCVCEYPSRIYVESVLQDTQSINLQLTGTALTEPQVAAGTPASPLQQGYKFASNGLGVLGAGLVSFNKLSGYYGKVRDWQGAAEDGSSFSGGSTGGPYDDAYYSGTPRPALNILGEVLPGWLSLGKTAVELLKFITGSKGMGSGSRITGYSTSFNLDVTGTLSITDYANPSSFNAPSSEAQNSDDFQNGSDPIYGNPLGVFNLVRTPEIRRRDNIKSEDIGRIYDSYYSFDGNDLDYVVNTSAGFEPIPRRLMLSLVFEGCPYEVRTMRLLDQRVGGDFRTPFVDAACFEDQFVNFYSDLSGRGDGGDGSISGGGNGGVTGTVLDPGGITGTVFDPGGNGGIRGGGNEPVKVTDLREFDCIGQRYLQVLATLIPTDGSDDVVFMGSYKVSVSSAEPIRAALPFNGFFSDEAAAISCSSPIVPPITAEDLSSFCKEEYDPKTSKSGVAPGIIKETQKSSITLAEGAATGEIHHTVFPNPFVNKVTIQVSGETPRSIFLYDLSGRSVFSRENLALDHQKIQMALETLPTGSYQLRLLYGDRVESSIITKILK